MHIAAISAGAFHSLTSVSPAALLLAVGLHLLKVCSEARAWHGIVSHAHRDHAIRFRTTLAAFTGSIGANALLPGRVGEAFRIGVVRRSIPGSSVTTVAATIVLETVLELVFALTVFAIVFLSGSSFGPAGGRLHNVQRLAGHPVVIGTVAAIGAATVIGTVVYRRHVRTLFASLARGFSVVRAPRVLVTRVLSWKLVAWSLRLAAVYWFLVAFHLPPRPWAVLLVIGSQNLSALVPLSPGNAGTQQAVFAVALAGSASAASILGFGVGMQAATAVSDLIVGATAILLVARPGELRAALATLHRRRARLAAG